jgi:ketol-acid reductoisomerase
MEVSFQGRCAAYRRALQRRSARQSHANIKNGAALLFAHGLNVHFNLLEPRADLDVLMIAPKGPRPHRALGIPARRRRALPDRVHKDASGNAHDLGLGYASAIGGGRAGIIGGLLITARFIVVAS